MHKISITRICKKVKNSTIKHSPEILIGLGIAGMITSTIMAVKATPKVLILIEDEKRHINHEILEQAKADGIEECERVERYLEVLYSGSSYWNGIGCLLDWSQFRESS